MNDFNPQYRPGIVGSGAMNMAVDAGLRSFMLGVYNKMGLGLVWSAMLAWAVANYAPLTNALFTVSEGRLGYTGLGWLIAFAPLVLVFGSSFMMRNPSKTGTAMLYWAVVTTIGLGLGVWVILYTATSLASTFFATAAAFGGLSLFAYTTKKDLSGMGSFLIMAVWGLLAMMLINAFFVKSAGLDLVISGAGVLIFSGLIAFRTQQLKHTYYEIGGNETALAVATNYGALSLYIDFINLFQFLLRFLGDRR